MRKEICYITSDGSLFLDQQKAMQHEVGVTLREFYDSCPIVDEEGRIVSVDKVVGWATSNLHELQAIFESRDW